MDRETTLDEFAEAEGQPAEEPESKERSELVEDSADEGREADDVQDEVADDGDDRRDAPAGSGGSDSIEVTSRWNRDGEPCDGCGTSVRRRWRVQDDLVCAECRDW